MAKRRQSEGPAAQAGAEQCIRELADSSSASEIEKAKSLLDAGVIDASEFAAHKVSGLR